MNIHFIKILITNIFENTELIGFFSGYTEGTYNLIYKKEQTFQQNKKNKTLILKSTIPPSISLFPKRVVFII